MPYVVKIGWGSGWTDDPESVLFEESKERVGTYTFETKAEAMAFLFGADEGSGWMDYTVAEEIKEVD